MLEGKGDGWVYENVVGDRMVYENILARKKSRTGGLDVEASVIPVGATVAPPSRFEATLTYCHLVRNIEPADTETVTVIPSRSLHRTRLLESGTTGTLSRYLVCIFGVR